MTSKQKLAIATISMGWHDNHTLERKLAAAQNHGIQGIELVDKDLNKYARAHGVSRLLAAEEIRQLCQNANIEIFVYASFDNFEGDRTPLEDRLAKAREWCDVATRAGTNMIQIPSNADPRAIGNEEVIVSELQVLADLGQQHDPPVRFAYEALGWGTHVADWEESLRIVQLVNRENFGLCLDTYHVLGRLWADPMHHSGRRPAGDVAMRDTLKRFRTECPTEKIFYIQLSDAEKAVPPLLPGHPTYRENEAVLASWCFWGRLFPYESEAGAYLPMAGIIHSWLSASGYAGWVSMEIFHRTMKDENPGPEVWAERAKISWETIRTMLRKETD